MAKQYRVDTSEGMAEYIKSINDEQLAKDTYYQNWQKWLKVPTQGGYGTSIPPRANIPPVEPVVAPVSPVPTGADQVIRPPRHNTTPVEPDSTQGRHRTSRLPIANTTPVVSGSTQGRYRTSRPPIANITPVETDAAQVSRPSTADTDTMSQNREDFYKNLTASATESADIINKYWDATNLALKQKAGYDISQAYKHYLEQETALKESSLAAGSKAYVGGELSEAYKETKTDVDTSLAANLESAEAKRTEQLETVKTGVDKAREEYDALFESSKYNIENGKKITDLTNNINIGLATFADSTDIKKNLDSLQAEYDKKDAIATRLEATDNTEAAKAARAEANAIKKIIDTTNNKLQTYA